jgi:8-amino-7-oxononanoate synthase
MTLLTELEAQLQQREAQHLKRSRAVVESASGTHVQVDGKTLLCFCSNDYLGLANHPKVVEAFVAAAKQYGVGSGASHLVSGHTALHHQLEETFARITGREKALLFSTGYMANMGVITALLDKQDAIFEDKLNHASLLDGGLLSGAKFQRYLHNDMTSLEKHLEKTSSRRKLICVDGVFSMDGDIARLPELAKLAHEYDALLMVDDAHGFGVLGENGLGCCDALALTVSQVPLLMCTLGKALGTFGALVAGPETLIETLVQYARPYIYTTALPPAVAAATIMSLKLLDTEAWRRDKLQELITFFRQEAALIGLPLMPSTTAIQPLLIGDEAMALKWQEQLKQAGFWISAIRTPTVAKGAARLRITFSANHTKADIQQLLDTLNTLQKRLPLLNRVSA